MIMRQTSAAAIDLPKRLADRLDLRRALMGEIRHQPNLLPRGAAEFALASRVDEFSGRWQAAMQTSAFVRRGSVVWGDKGRLTARPIAVMPLRERVVYRALVNDVMDAVSGSPLILPSSLDFTRAPLSSRSTKYIVMADISSFYQFVDHGLIVDEVAELTARTDTAATLFQFLPRATGLGLGVPQNVGPSRHLAEFVGQSIERELLREGLTVYRWNDDFRFSVRSWHDVAPTLRQFRLSLLRRGLAPNDSKTFVYGRDKYSEMRQTAERIQSAEFESVGMDVPEGDPYTGVLRVPSAGVAAIGLSKLATNILEALLGEPDRIASDAVGRREILVLVRGVLKALGEAVDLGAIAFGERLLRTEPQLSDAYGTYLGKLARVHPGEVSAHIDRLGRMLKDSTPWQRVWVTDALRRPGTSMGNAAAKWIAEVLQDKNSGDLRAIAARCLAMHHRIGRSELIALATNTDSPLKSEIVAGLALSGARKDRTIRSVLDGDFEMLAIYEAFRRLRRPRV